MPAPDDPTTIAVRDWIIDRLAQLEPTARPNAPWMRSKTMWWLRFHDPDCLIYKVEHGFVDIYLPKIWPDNPARQTEVHESNELPEGFEPAVDSEDKLILRRVVHRPMGRTERADLASRDDLEALAAGVDACVAAIRWVRTVSSS